MQSSTKERKKERIEARVSVEQKMLIERAAALSGCSVSEYLVRSAQEAAERDVRDHDLIVLSARDSQLFVEALLNPQPPNSALTAAAQEYVERWRASDAQ